MPKKTTEEDGEPDETPVSKTAYDAAREASPADGLHPDAEPEPEKAKRAAPGTLETRD